MDPYIAQGITFAYFPQKRSNNDDNADLRPKVMAAEVSSKVQDKLDDKYKLANAREFPIQGNLNGQMLGCGVEVRKYPDNSRFRVRIYDHDRNNGKSRTFIELTLDEFLRLKRYEDTIKRYLHYVRHKESIFRYEDFSVTVVPTNYRPELQLSKLDSRIYMSENTYLNMMSYEETMRNEYAECQQRNDEDRRQLDDLANIMAFQRNEERVNDFVGRPAEWFQGGTVTTWKKFRDQAAKSMERLRKMFRKSDQSR